VKLCMMPRQGRGPVDKPGWPRLSISGGRNGSWSRGMAGLAGGSPADSAARTGRHARAAWSCLEGAREAGLALSRRARCGRRDQRGRCTRQRVRGHVDVSKPRIDELAYRWRRWHGAVGDEGPGVDPGGVRALSTSWLAACFEWGQELLGGSGADCRCGVECGVVQEQRGLVWCVECAEQGRGGGW